MADGGLPTGLLLVADTGLAVELRTYTWLATIRTHIVRSFTPSLQLPSQLAAQSAIRNSQPAIRNPIQGRFALNAIHATVSAIEGASLLYILYEGESQFRHGLADTCSITSVHMRGCYVPPEKVDTIERVQDGFAAIVRVPAPVVGRGAGYLNVARVPCGRSRILIAGSDSASSTR